MAYSGSSLFAFAYSIETKVAAASVKTIKLRQFILAKAFSGELVETELKFPEEKAEIMSRLRFCLKE